MKQIEFKKQIVEQLVKELNDTTYIFQFKTNGLYIDVEQRNIIYSAAYNPSVCLTDKKIELIEKLIKKICAERRCLKETELILKISLKKLKYNAEKDKYYSEITPVTININALNALDAYTNGYNIASLTISSNNRHSKSFDLAWPKLPKYINKDNIEEVMEILNDSWDLERIVKEMLIYASSAGEEVYIEMMQYAEKELFREGGGFAMVNDSIDVLDPIEDMCEAYVDGRLSEWDDAVLEDFWWHHYGTFPDTLNNIAFPAVYNVVHYKGKDWYICKEANLEEFELPYNIYDIEIVDDEVNVQFNFEYYTYTEQKKDYLSRYLNVAKWLMTEKEYLNLEAYIKNGIFDNEIIKDLAFELPENIDLADITVAWDHWKSILDSYGYTPISVVKFKSEGSFDDELDFHTYLIDIISTAFVDVEPKSYKKMFGNAISQYLMKQHQDGNAYDAIQLLQDYVKKYYRKVDIIIDNNMLCVKVKGKYDYHLFDDDLYVMALYTLNKYDIAKIDIYEIAFKIYQAIEKRRLERIKHKELFKRAKSIFVGLHDSIAAGNCEYGTRSFCERHGIDLEKIGGLRGDYVLELETTPYTIRAVHNALMRKKFKEGE